jgi:hypothetical protein
VLANKYILFVSVTSRFNLNQQKIELTITLNLTITVYHHCYMSYLINRNRDIIELPNLDVIANTTCLKPIKIFENIVEMCDGTLYYIIDSELHKIKIDFGGSYNVSYFDKTFAKINNTFFQFNEQEKKATRILNIDASNIRNIVTIRVLRIGPSGVYIRNDRANNIIRVRVKIDTIFYVNNDNKLILQQNFMNTSDDLFCYSKLKLIDNTIVDNKLLYAYVDRFRIVSFYNDKIICQNISDYTVDSVVTMDKIMELNFFIEKVYVSSFDKVNHIIDTHGNVYSLKFLCSDDKDQYVIKLKKIHFDPSLPINHVISLAHVNYYVSVCGKIFDENYEIIDCEPLTHHYPIATHVKSSRFVS